MVVCFTWTLSERIVEKRGALCAFAGRPRRRPTSVPPFNQKGRQHEIMTYTEHGLARLADKWRPRTQLVSLKINGGSGKTIGGVEWRPCHDS